MDYSNLDFSKEEEIWNSDAKEMYGPSNVEIKVR